MAVIGTIGQVESLKVGDDYGFVTIVEDSGDKEILILWFNPAAAFSVARFRQLAWLTLLRKALVGSLRVRISHEDDSAEALEVRLLAPAGP